MRNLKPSRITATCVSESDRSDTGDNEYVPSEYSDQEEFDNMSTSETVSDGDNVTAASDDSDARSETVGGYEPKNGQIWNKVPPLVSRCRKHNIGTLGLTVYTYLLTPWSRVLLEKLTGFAANQEIPRTL